MYQANANLQRILVVEDDETQRMILVEILRHLGVPEVLEASDGKHALEIIRSQSMIPDLVITDLEMPNMDGVSLVGQLADSRMCQSVILISSFDDSLLYSVRTLCEETGLIALGVLQKPFAVETLETLLKKFHPQNSEAVRVAKLAQVTDDEIPLDEILQALQNGEFGLYYQPKIDPKNHQCKGVEALVRWFSPQRGMVPPYYFIPLLESKGLMRGLTRYVIEMATEQAVIWRNKGYELTISINLSAQNLNDESLVDNINQLIKAKNLRPNEVIFEVTESSVIDNPVQALGALARLRLRGFGLSIDDYGTGFSSMSQLSRIPFTELKLDRSLVHEAHKHPERRVILQSAVEMAKKLNLKIVAEGVEEEEDYIIIRDLGCDMIQGYYYSKPITPEEIESKYFPKT